MAKLGLVSVDADDDNRVEEEQEAPLEVVGAVLVFDVIFLHSKN